MLALGAGAAIWRNRNKATPVLTARVATQDIVSKVTANGKIQAENKVEMSALVQGQVVNLAVREGDKVKKGDFLLQIDRNRAALEPASSAAARLRSIWRRKSPFLTLSPSRTARFTTWPWTSADISTLFSAWILPLAVTLETMSWVATRAVRTGVALFRLRQIAAPAPNASMPATMIQMRRLRRVKARQATPRPDQRQRIRVPRSETSLYKC